MEVNTLKNKAEARMSKSMSVFSAELSRIRTGRAHPGLLDHITVEYYGNKTLLNQLCNIVIEDVATLRLQVWEKDLVDNIEKAIINSDLGLNPAVSGTVVRIPIPPLSEERRKDLVKVVRQHGEATKVSVRNIRRDLNQQVKSALKEKKISKDEEKNAEVLMQKVTDRFIADIDALLADKEKDLMAV